MIITGHVLARGGMDRCQTIRHYLLWKMLVYNYIRITAYVIIGNGQVIQLLFTVLADCSLCTRICISVPLQSYMQSPSHTHT